MDEEYAKIRDQIPRLWWNIYQGCLQEGFDPGQAFALLQTWILAQNPNGIRPPEKSGPEGDT